MWVTRYVRVYRQPMTTYLRVGLIILLLQTCLLLIFHLILAPAKQQHHIIYLNDDDIRSGAYVNSNTSISMDNGPNEISSNTPQRRQQRRQEQEVQVWATTLAIKQTGSGQGKTTAGFQRQRGSGGGDAHGHTEPSRRQTQRPGKRPNPADVRGLEEAAKKKKFLAFLTKRERGKAVLSRECLERDVKSQVTNMVFVKVHKSASSTVANMLACYALRYALNVALPKKVPGQKRFNYFETKILPEQVIPLQAGQQYHVLFNHMIFNRQDLQAFMPKDTFYFAIMRDPEDRFISSFVYYRIGVYVMKRFGLTNLKDALMFMINRVDEVKIFLPEVHNSFASNTGLRIIDQLDVRSVKAHIRRLERDLDLIMIVEYFDESLVLLKRRACLSTQDIIYSVKNARQQGLRFRPSFTPQERQSFQKFQMADVLIYNHFYKRFWELVYAEGPDFFAEVQHLKQIRRTVEDFCRSVASRWDFVNISRSAWNEEFMVTARECRLIAMDELNMQLLLMHRASVLSNVSGRGF